MLEMRRKLRTKMNRRRKTRKSTLCIEREVRSNFPIHHKGVGRNEGEG
jgi:hypothetical protein